MHKTSPSHIDLSGPWSLSSDDGRIQCPMQVPGDVHSALLQDGQLPDPYYGTNEEEVQWVGETGWIIERGVHVPQEMIEAESIYLNADALDTFCEIQINGVTAGSTANRFRRHRLEIKPFLRPGENQIVLKFGSSSKAMLTRSEKLPYPIPHIVSGQKIPHWNLIRKPMCHAGWDWGIALQAIAVSGDLSIRAVHAVRIEHVWTHQTICEGTCRLDVFAEVHSLFDGKLDWETEIDGKRARSKTAVQFGHNLLQSTIEIAQPKLWWPIGFGEPFLYELRVTISGETVAKRIGLRSVVVKNKPDTIGRPLTFSVNGIDIFCKGANWVPSDALPSRQTEDRVRELILSAKEANMNMLTVWCGRQFVSDAFYNLCDEHGIMVWHDFMFSCALYPADSHFLEEIRQEVRYQVRRLRDHPAIVLWCGDNENIGALTWFKESRKNRDRYLLDWDKLNTTRREAALDADETRVYWPSSPCAGPGDFSDSWHTDGKGDMHYWSVWGEGKSFDAYYDIKPRFCSEFGYQSFPSLQTVVSYCPPDQMNITAPVMEFHQRNAAGNRLINEMFSRYFRMPVGFAATIYLSQVQQAVAIKTAVEYWRTLRPECMGVLYWQLNDVWPVASWSSLEYNGKWKQLHYHAKRFYTPVITCILQRNDVLQLWAVNDCVNSTEATIRVELWSFSGDLLRTECIDSQLEGGSAKEISTWDISEFAADQKARASAFLQITLETSTDGKRFSHENTHWFTEFKRCSLARAEVRCEIDGCKVTLSTEVPAFFVHVDVENAQGEFDDNSFTLLPNRARTLTFIPKGQPALEPLELKVTNLSKTY